MPEEVPPKSSPLTGGNPSLPASLFGKAAQGISDADTAAGLIRLVLQTIGSSAALCAAGYGITDLVLIGRLCTALGAALSD